MRFLACRTRSSAFVTAVVLTAVVAGLCAPPAEAGRSLPLHEKKHDAKRQVEALEEQWRVAQLAGDIPAMDKLLSDDYIGISMTGQVHTKAQQLERMRSRAFVLNKIDLGEIQVKLVGAIAIVTSRADVEGVSDGIPVKGTYRYTRVYQRLPSGDWRITSFEATRVPTPRGPKTESHETEPSSASTTPQSGPF